MAVGQKKRLGCCCWKKNFTDGKVSLLHNFLIIFTADNCLSSIKTGPCCLYPEIFFFFSVTVGRCGHAIRHSVSLFVSIDRPSRIKFEKKKRTPEPIYIKSHLHFSYYYYYYYYYIYIYIYIQLPRSW